MPGSSGMQIHVNLTAFLKETVSRADRSVEQRASQTVWVGQIELVEGDSFKMRQRQRRQRQAERRAACVMLMINHAGRGF